MEKLIITLSTLIAFIFPITAHSSGSNQFYSEEEGAYFDIPPPPAKKISSQDIYKDLSQGKGVNITFMPAERWPVRAVYVERAKDILEFDRHGRVVFDGNDPIDPSQLEQENFSMEQLFLNGKPFWIGADIFRKIGASNREEISPLFATMPSGLVRARNGKFCPVREIGSKKRFGLDQYTIDGDCETAIQVNINGSQYWTYPAFKKIKEPYFYWKIQYFSDPIEPFPSPGEGCLLYCDEASRKAAEERSKAN